MSKEGVSSIKVRFLIGEVGEAEAELIRYFAPRTVGAIARSLPIEGQVARWKEEVYFEIPLKMGEEKPESKVEQGAIAYWPMGNAICVFHGETQPYSPVNIVGKVTKNLHLFKQTKSGARITLEKI
ncbi:MAG: hypothetical protein JSV85_02005 [Candidatus Bathyarchaeota archaeon]|nr:MAG: hypothetical protein JSV85_02005 [Candidatus Bathyarchaeota archaeon]